MNCKQIREEYIFRYVDGEMGQQMRLEYQRHVSDCPHCAESARITHRVLLVVRQCAGRCAAPSRLRDRILAGLPHRNGQKEARS